ncbi:hypothetical protein Tco_1578795 [Tanacetum coccineum]
MMQLCNWLLKLAFCIYGAFYISSFELKLAKIRAISYSLLERIAYYGCTWSKRKNRSDAEREDKVETIIFKLEVITRLDKKAGVITPLGAPIPVLLTFDAAVEALQPVSIQYGVFQ